MVKKHNKVKHCRFARTQYLRPCSRRYMYPFKIIALTLLSVFSYVSNADVGCGFMDTARDMLKVPATEAAQERKYGEFIGVANGYTSTNPNLDNFDELDCVMKQHRYKLVWMGADVIRCKDQVEVGLELVEFAEIYNKEVKQSLVNAGEYECNM